MATYAAYRHIELDNVGYGKKRVLKPPGGGSSDIFGTGQEEISPRRVKNHTQSQLGSQLFGGNGGSSTGSSSPETPRSNKPGNDSHNRLFGPPDPQIHSKKNHMRSNISFSGDISNTTNMSNGARINGGNALINDNANTNDNSGRMSCMPRNPVTGDGIAMACRRNTRRYRDGNPVTGIGYSDQQNNVVASQNGSSAGSVNGDIKSSTDSSPNSNKTARARVPPGGYSSGLW